MNATRRLLVLVTALLTLGCSSTSVSIVSFRSPPGSELSFKDEQGLAAGSVVFPGNLELAQFAAKGDDFKRLFTGRLRVNELVEEELVPSEARSLLVEGEGGVDIPVKGFYRVFSRSMSTEEKLSTYPVEVSRKQLLRLLTGKAVTISADEKGVLDMTVGLDLDADRRSRSE